MKSFTPLVTYRLLTPADSLEELTELLHRAYKVLADMGFKFVATYQDVETTRKRCTQGECWIGLLDGRIVSTISLTFPYPKDATPWYREPGVAVLQQFAVEPALQGHGIGNTMMDLVERRATELGATEAALDTSEGAHHLIRYYTKRGYRFIEHVQWDVTNYRSVVMSKTLNL